MTNTIVGSIVNYKHYIVVAFVGVIAYLYARFQYHQYKLEQLKVDTLYGEVVNKLRRQARLAKNATEIPSYINSTQLRDLILTNEFNLRKKQGLWSRVSSKIEHNLNVRHRLIESHGEIMRVWEWVSEIDI